MDARSGRPADIGAHLAIVNAVMADPQKWLASHEAPLRVDAMLVKREGPEDGAVRPIELTDFYSASGERRIVLPGYIPCDEIPPPADGLDAAMRFLSY